MAKNQHFFNTEYPEFLIKELAENRYNRKFTTKPNVPTIDVKCYNYNPDAAAGQEFSLSAEFNSQGEMTNPVAIKKNPATNRSPFITSISVEAGGTDRTGKVIKGEMTIELSNTNNLNAVIDSVAKLGNKIEITCNQNWKTGTAVNDEANELNVVGRIYDFSYQNSGIIKAVNAWSVTVKFMGMGEVYSQIDTLASVDPKSANWPKQWPKEYKPLDYEGTQTSENDIITVQNLGDVISAIFVEQFNKQENKIGFSEDAYGRVFGIDRLERLNWWGHIIENSWSDIYDIFMSFGSLVDIINEYIQYIATETDDELLKGVEITYSEDVETQGSYYPWLTSSNPAEIVLPGVIYTPGYNRYAAAQGITDLPFKLGGLPGVEDKYKYVTNVTPKTRGNIKNIMISRNLIETLIISSFAPKDELVKDEEKINQQTIEAFFEKLFKVIRDTTGGVIGLQLQPYLKNALTGDESKKLIIVDKNVIADVEGTIKPPLGLYLYPHGNRFVESIDKKNGFAISGNIPKSLAGKAFVKNSNVLATKGNTSLASESSDTSLTEQEQKNLLRIIERTKFMTTAKGQQLKNLQLAVNNAMKKLFNGNVLVGSEFQVKGNKQKNADDVTARKRITSNLTLSFKTYGINGFRWGHAIAIKPLPTSVLETTAFFITNIKHTIDMSASTGAAGKSWKTDFTCIAIPRPKSEFTNIKYLGEHDESDNVLPIYTSDEIINTYT